MKYVEAICSVCTIDVLKITTVMAYVQFPTYKVQQLACNKICKQISCYFLTQLTVTADRIHTLNICFIPVYTFVNSVVVLHLFPDTSIEKEKDRQ